MKKILVSDFSKVQLFSKDNTYIGGLNKLYDWVLDKDEKFNNHFVLNESLLNELSKLNIDKYVFTTGKVQNAPEIINKVKAVFKKIFNVPMIGYLKTNPKAYLVLCDEIGVKPNQVMFIDDLEVNVRAARKAGLHAVVYEGNSKVLKLIKSWLDDVQEMDMGLLLK